MQGDGWFLNEISPQVGPFQWAGGMDLKASMHLDLPDDTKGILLKMNSIANGMWIKVKIDDELITTLRADDTWWYWHTGYVPIGNPTTESKTTALPEWEAGHYFPKFPSTEKIFTIPIQDTKVNTPQITGVADFRINQEYKLMMALTLTGMQGIINRDQPRIYLDYTSTDVDWLSELGKQVNVVDLGLEYLSAFRFLLDRYGSFFDGVVIYDPDVPETINVATMIAGLENRIMLAPDQLSLPGVPVFSSITDLRDLVAVQNWDTSDESKYRIYEWVYENLWPSLEHRMIGVISPGPPTSQESSPGIYFRMGLASRDYYIALQLPTLWLDPSKPSEAELFGRFLAEAPAPIPVHGVSPWELSSVPFISGYGDWVTALSWPQNPLDGGNLTVLSGIRPELKKYEPQINPNRILATLDTKHVAMIWSSDGDNLGYQLYRGFPSFLWPEATQQGGIWGWSTNPALIDLAPAAWNYYVESRNETGLVCGFSGAGYTNPRNMSNAQHQRYLENSVPYLNETGLKIIWVNDYPNNAPWSTELAANYYNELQQTGLLGILFGTVHSPWGYHFAYAGSPIPAVHPSYALEPPTIEEIANQLLSQSTDSILIQFGSDYGWHMGKVVQDVEATEGEALSFSVNSSGYREIITGPFIQLPPGGYTALFRLKVADNKSKQDFLKINVSHATYTGIASDRTGFVTVAEKTIAPADFNVVNEYVEIRVPFTLDEITGNLEFIVSLKENIDLLADQIKIIKDEPDDFPVFASLLIVTTRNEYGTQIKSPQLFKQKFEQAGGIVLTPEEFMSALNPQYMIELATTILGAGNADLAESKKLLNEGEFYSSLLTVRKALNTVLTDVEKFDKPQSEDQYHMLAYPNPFHASTTIEFSILESTHVKATIFNSQGQQVAILADEEMTEGLHKVKFNAQNLDSGVYIIQLESEAFRVIKKLLYLR